MTVHRRAAYLVLALGLLAASEGRAEVLRWVLIGDTGSNCQHVDLDDPREAWLARLESGQQTQVARHLAQIVREENVRDIFFLGDNFYPDGLQPGPMGDACLDMAFTTPYGDLLPPEHLHLVPGNHDHYTKGSVERQAALSGKLWSYSTRPALLHLEPGLVDVILFDSVAMLISDKARQEYQGELTERLLEAKAPWVLLMAHHPLHTIGEHSYRTFFGLFNKHDFSSSKNRAYRAAVKGAIVASRRPVQLFAAGHDHSLQFLRENEPGSLVPDYHIVSGSGGKTSMVHSLGDRRWGAAVPGFVVLELDTEKPEVMAVRFLDSARRTQIRRYDIPLEPAP